MFILSSLSFLLSLFGVAVDNSRSINEEYKDIILCIINFHINGLIPDSNTNDVLLGFILAVETFNYKSQSSKIIAWKIKHKINTIHHYL